MLIVRSGIVAPILAATLFSFALCLCSVAQAATQSGAGTRPAESRPASGYPRARDYAELAKLQKPVEGALRLLLVRHGESVGNATRDDPKLTDAEKDKLTEKGAQQATALGAVLATVAVDRLYTSPANRTVATAESVLKALSTRPGLALVPLPGVGPITLGKAPSEKSPAINSLVASWQAGRDLRLEGGENLADMTARAKKALADIVKSVRAGQTAVVVAHGEILLSYLCEFDVARTMQALVSYRLPNACILAFDATEKGALFLDLFAAPAAPASRPSEK